MGVEEPFKYIAEEFLKRFDFIVVDLMRIIFYILCGRYEESGQSVEDFNRNFTMWTDEIAEMWYVIYIICKYSGATGSILLKLMG